MAQNRSHRADAVRNRSRILAVAREQISANGPEVAMAQLARAAGVAVGTLYRHFPNKTDLIAAVIAEHIAEVADDAVACLARARKGQRAVDEMIGFLDRVSEATAHNRAVKVAARGLGVNEHGNGSDERRAAAAISELIRMAQATGDIRDGVSVSDIYLLMATAPTDLAQPVRKRWLELLLRGILT